MIESLDIANLGVIASAHVDFGPGLIVVTGETGAGKTMVLSSLQLLLGARADAALVRSGADRLSVDGIFTVGDQISARVEEAGGIVEGGELIVGRSVRAAGRSRAHLGSRPVPASALSEIVGSMVTIHGQADQIRLTGEAAQRRALDQFGGATHASLVQEYREAFRAAVEIKHRLDSLRGDASDREEEREDLRAALEQIEALDPQVGEEEDLIREASRLANVEDLRALMGVALGYLKGDDRGDFSGAVEAARSAYAQLDDAARFDEAVAESRGVGTSVPTPLVYRAPAGLAAAAHWHGSPTMSHVIPLQLFPILKLAPCNSNVCERSRILTEGNYVRDLGERGGGVRGRESAQPHNPTAPQPHSARNAHNAHNERSPAAHAAHAAPQRTQKRPGPRPRAPRQ